IAASEQCGRPLAILDDADWNHYRAPGGLIHRNRQLEIAMLNAIGIEIDGGANRAWTLAHKNSWANHEVDDYLTNSWRGKLASVSAPCSVIKILSVIS